MQLKIRRSQRDGGVISKTAIFCLDARVEFTAEEQRHIRRYKLGKEIIYDSQARTALIERSASARDQGGRPINYHGDVGEMLGGAARSAASGVFSAAKSLSLAAMASVTLRVTVDSLERGQHIECKSLEELIAAEDAIMAACTNLRNYLDVAATFDGREVLFSFDTGEPEPIAKAVSPAPALITTPPPVAGASQPAAPPASDWKTTPAAHAHEDVAQPEDAEAIPVEEPAQYGDDTFTYGSGNSDDMAKVLMAAVAIVLAVVFVIGVLPGPFLFRIVILAAVLFFGQKAYKSFA